MHSNKNSSISASIFDSYVKFIKSTRYVRTLAISASKIELFASNQDTNTVEDVMNINWDYLGYITLSDNQSTGFKSRELKSVNVPTCVASFLKLKLGNNHTNAYNINNQVSY